MERDLDRAQLALGPLVLLVVAEIAEWAQRAGYRKASPPDAAPQRGVASRSVRPALSAAVRHYESLQATLLRGMVTTKLELGSAFSSSLSSADILTNSEGKTTRSY